MRCIGLTDRGRMFGEEAAEIHAYSLALQERATGLRIAAGQLRQIEQLCCVILSSDETIFHG